MPFYSVSDRARPVPRLPRMDLEWRNLTADPLATPTSLFLDGKEVARLWQRADTRAWFATLDMLKPSRQRVDRPCRSFASGKQGCELWVQRHARRLAKSIAEAHSCQAQVRGCCGAVTSSSV